MHISSKTLGGLPIFLGLSEKDLTDIVHNTRFNLRHHKKGSVIIEEGQPCTSLICVMEGWVETDTYSDNRTYHLKELIESTQMMEPDKLFGLAQRYRSTCTAYTPCESISISKEEMTQLLERYIIVRLNYLNLLCRMSQQLEELLWQTHTTNMTERITQFIKQHSRYATGRKILHIKMSQLADELNVSRLEISNTLNSMNDEEKIILKRGMIEIPALQLL